MKFCTSHTRRCRGGWFSFQTKKPKIECSAKRATHSPRRVRSPFISSELSTRRHTHTCMHLWTFFIFGPTLAENVSWSAPMRKKIHPSTCCGAAIATWLESEFRAPTQSDWLRMRVGERAGDVLFWISHTRITNNQRVKTAQIDYGVRVKWCVILQQRRPLFENILQNNERSLARSAPTYAAAAIIKGRKSVNNLFRPQRT